MSDETRVQPCREESSTHVGTQPHDVRPCMCCPVYFMAIALMQPECNCAHATETRFGVLPNLLAACFLMTSRADAASVSHHSCICILRNSHLARSAVTGLRAPCSYLRTWALTAQRGTFPPALPRCSCNHCPVLLWRSHVSCTICAGKS